MAIPSNIFVKIDEHCGSAPSERQSITLTVGRDRKIQTVQRTNGTLGFVTLSAACYSSFAFQASSCKYSVSSLLLFNRPFATVGHVTFFFKNTLINHW